HLRSFSSQVSRRLIKRSGHCEKYFLISQLFVASLLRPTIIPCLLEVLEIDRRSLQRRYFWNFRSRLPRQDGLSAIDFGMAESRFCGSYKSRWIFTTAFSRKLAD